MLRPYLAIIKDSFRAAIASRVLVLMLVIIALFLAVIVPFRLIEEPSWEIDREAHLGDSPDAVYSLVVENRENKERQDLVYVWNKMSKDFQDRAIEFYEYDQRKLKGEFQEEYDESYEGFARLGLYNDFVRELNKLIEDPEFYDPKIWAPEALLSAEANELATYGLNKLDTMQKRRLNRLVISQAFDSLIKPPSESSAKLSYSYVVDEWEIGKFPSGKIGFHQTTASVLPWVLDKFVLSAGMLISILVTASVMPSMFEHGSLSLLLSKPIYRWGLYVAKFIGACAFALLLSAFLFLGLWFILGIRIGYWDSSLLYSIPIYVIVFAIYYSVSSFLGMYFKNTIIAVVGTIMFWIACFLVGETYKSFDKYMYLNDGVAVSHEGKSIVQTDRVGISRYWNEEQGTWVPTLMAQNTYEQTSGIKLGMMFPFLPRIDFPKGISPVYSPKYQVWIGASRGFEDMQNPQPTFIYSLLEEGFDFHPAGQLPTNARGFLRHPDGEIIVATARGDFYRLDKDPREVAEQVLKIEKAGQKLKDDAKAKRKKKKGAAEDKNSDKTPFAEKPAETQPKMPEVFKEIGPDRPVDILDRRMVDLNQENKKIAIYRSSSVFIFDQNDQGEYQLEKKADLELGVDSSMSAWVIYQGDNLFVCLGNGEIFMVDGDSLEKQKSYLPESRSAIFSVSGSPNGRFLAVTYRNGNLWLLDQEDPNRLTKINVKGQGDVKTSSFDSQGNLCVVSRTDRVMIYDPVSLSVLEKASDKGYFIKNRFYFPIRPLYQIFPKPGEFYKLVSHLASSRQTETNRDLDLTKSTEPEKPWEPFISGICFMFGVVMLSCIIFMRTDY